MPETPDDLVHRFQAQLEADRKVTIEVLWSDPGPYRLPRCAGRQGVMLVDRHTVELQLETEQGQRVLIPLDADMLEPLASYLSQIAKAIALAKRT
jgi:hypothetical protein